MSQHRPIPHKAPTNPQPENDDFEGGRPPPIQDQSAPVSPPSAGILRRLLALVYDSFLLFGISIAYAALVLVARILILGQEQALATSSELFQALQLLGLWLVLAYFYVWCWRRSGQTLGMKVWRLRLQQADNRPPSTRQCWRRCVLAPLSLLTIIGYLWALVDPQGNCLHDRWTKTRVVLLPKA